MIETKELNDNLIDQMVQAGRFLKDSITYDADVKDREENILLVKGTTISRWLSYLERSSQGDDIKIFNFLKIFSAGLIRNFEDQKILEQNLTITKKSFYLFSTPTEPTNAIINQFLNAMNSLLKEKTDARNNNMNFISSSEQMKVFLIKYPKIAKYINTHIKVLVFINNYYLSHIESFNKKRSSVENKKRYDSLSGDLLNYQSLNKKRKIQEKPVLEEENSSYLASCAQIFNNPDADENEISELRKKLGISEDFKILEVLSDGSIQMQKTGEEPIWDHVDSLFHSSGQPVNSFR